MQEDTIRRTRVIRSLAVGVLLAVVTVLVGRWGIHVYERVHRYHESQARCAALELVGKALQQYAEVSEGNYYPPRSSKPGVFLPDFDVWEKGAPDKSAFQEARAILTDPKERQICYLGYAFRRDAYAQRILDSCEANPSTFLGGRPTTPEAKPSFDPASNSLYDIHPLKKDVYAYFVWEVPYTGGPSGSAWLAYEMPSLWELPRGSQDEVAVLYLSGLARTGHYPGPLVTSKLFVNRIRGLLGIPQDSDFRNDSPMIPIVRRISEASIPGKRASLLVTDFDSTPSVAKAGVQGYRIKIGLEELVLFPEASGVAAIETSTLFSPPIYRGYERTLLSTDIGVAAGYHWYGRVEYVTLLLLKSALNPASGDGLYPSLAAHCIDYVWKGAATGGVQESITDYVKTFIERRRSTRRPVSAEIYEAGSILHACHFQDYGAAWFVLPSPDLVTEAEQRLLNASKKDPEAATTMALFYVLGFGIRGASFNPTDSGMEYIRKFPHDAVLSSLNNMIGVGGRELGPCLYLRFKLEQQP